MSGAISAYSQANSLPVRPNPVAISSGNQQDTFAIAHFADRFNHSGWYMRIPPAP